MGEIIITQKFPKIVFDVDVNKLNEQFVNVKLPTFMSNMYNSRVSPQYSFSFRCGTRPV